MAARVSILMGINEGYAPALAVAVTSLVQNLRSNVAVNLYLATNGLKDETLTHLEASWGDRVALFLIQVDWEVLNGLVRNRSSKQSSTVHFRALAISHLPQDLSRIVYLDSDLLIQRDIFELWERSMEGRTVLAVQDAFVQTLPAYCRVRDVAPQNPGAYFNSGVMVIDLEAWRSDGIEDCYRKALPRVRGLSRWADQDALNVCLQNRWGALPPVWNKQFALYLFPDWRVSPYDKSEFEEAMHTPGIVHFCTATKPWHFFCDHQSPDVLAFRSFLRKTGFGDFLEREPGWVRHVFEWFHTPHRQLLDNVAIAYRARRRKHAWQVLYKRILILAMRYPWTILSVPIAVAKDRLQMRWS